jgi:hypothetical protein
VTLQTDVPYDSTTYRYDVPEVDDEHLFVIIARQNGDIWIQAVVGKHGSVLGADANAIAMMAAYAIRYGAPEDKIIQDQLPMGQEWGLLPEHRGRDWAGVGG